VGINSFQKGKGVGNNYAYEGPDAAPHVVFQFQNLPDARRMNASTTTGGYPDSEMRKYLTAVDGAEGNGNFLEGLKRAGVPEAVLWAPSRFVSVKADGGPVEIKDKLWLPTEWEMFGSTFYAVAADETKVNQARLEYYTSDGRRTKYSNSNGARHWTVSLKANPTTNAEQRHYSVINTTGGNFIGDYKGSDSVGVAPAFCVW
jgi:hypothetical protein